MVSEKENKFFNFIEKNPSKFAIAVIVFIESLIILVSVCVIFEFEQHHKFKQNAGSATISLKTLDVQIESRVYHGNSRSPDLLMKVGKNTPGNSPANCWQTRRGKDHACLSWGNYARLLIMYSNPDPSIECYKFRWNFSNPQARTRDCFSKSGHSFSSTLITYPSQTMFLSDLTFNASIPGSGYFLETNERVGVTTNVNDQVYLLSNIGAFVVAVENHFPIALLSTEKEFCIDFDRTRDELSFSEASQKSFQYTVCTGENPTSVIKQTRQHLNEDVELDESSRATEFLQSATETIFWSFDPFQTNAGLYLDNFINFSSSENIFGNLRHILILHGHFPDEANFLDSSVLSKTETLINEYNVEVFFHTSPYFAVTNRNFVKGTEKNFWLKDYKENAPALSVLENVKTVLDPTNPKAVAWYRSLFLNCSEKLYAKGAVINADYLAKIPSDFKSYVQLNYPYEFAEKFTDDLLTILDESNMTDTFNLVTSSPKTLLGNSCVVMSAVSFSWVGLQSVIPQINSLAISGQKCWLPPPITDMSDQELFDRWLQLYIHFPAFSFDTNIADNLTGFDMSDLMTYRENVILPELRFSNVQSTTTDPVIKPLWYDFPEDEQTMSITDQFLVGYRYMIAPILEIGTTSRFVYLPKDNNWRLAFTGITTGKVYEGGKLYDIHPESTDKIIMFEICKFCYVSHL